MKKAFVLIILCVTALCARGQYFIPVFNNELVKARQTGDLIADTVNNYLYVPLSYYSTSGFDSSKVFAYRSNHWTQVGDMQNTPSGFTRGIALSSGGCVISEGYDNIFFHEIQGLSMNYCYSSVCGVNPWLSCLKTVNDTVYVGGSFSKFIPSGCHGIGGIAPGGPFNLGNGITNTTGGSVDDIEYFNGELYACGSFNSMNNSNSPSIARWDGNDWFPLGGGLYTPSGMAAGSKMEVYKNRLYVGGGFAFADNISCKGFARWNGNKWESAGNFEGGNYYDMKVYHDKLYMSGIFLTLPYAAGLIQYDENSFNILEPFGKWLTSSISSIEVFQDTLYIAGKFDSIGYIPAKRLAKFVDGTFSTYAPVTTKWWYNSSAEGQQQPNSCYKYYEVMRDTFVMNTPPTSGYNCRKIKAEQYLPNKTHTALQSLYVFGDTNRIMYYNNYQKRFVVGYKFNVKVGDTLTYYTPQPQSASDTTFRVVVDSLTTLTVQTEKLKRVYTNPLDGWSFGNDGYAQLIGGLASMLPQPISYFTNEGPLLCYQDTSLYFKYSTGGVNCDYAVSVVTEKKENSFTIYPNPVTNQFEVLGLKFEVGDEVAVTNLLGQEMERKVIANPISNLKFQVSSYPSGIYFIQIKTEHGAASGKFVKE